MQEGIIQMGSAILEKGDMLHSIILEVGALKGNRQQHILKLIFNLDDNCMEIDVNEQMSEQSSKKYFHIGSSSGGNSKQWYVTTTNKFFHLSETVANLCERDFGEELNEKVKLIRDRYYFDLGKEYKSNKNRYVLNLNLLGACKEKISEIHEKIIDENSRHDKKVKEALNKEFLKRFEGFLKEKFSMSFKDIGLYTIIIDGKAICDMEKYKEQVLIEKQGSKKKASLSKGICFSCGTDQDLNGKVNMDINLYTTNQFIFASDLDRKKYYKNMTLCGKCMEKLVVGEKYVINNLTTRFSGFSVYIIPHFIIGEGLNKEELDGCSKGILKSFNMVTNYSSVEDLKTFIDEGISYDGKETQVYYLINFLFFRNVQKATKAQKLIKDINPSMFTKIAYALQMSSEEYGRAFDHSLKLSLETAYYLTPIRVKGGESMQYRYLLNLYDCILTGRKINKKVIINNILYCCKIQYYDEKSFNVSSGNIINTSMNGSFFIKVLQYLGNLEGGMGMEVHSLMVDEKIKEYIQIMNYSEQQCALFMLGNLVGAVGNVQYKRSAEGKKPILNKLNFGGIDKSKLIRLANEVVARLKQEKILKYNETLLSECKRLLDKNFSSWDLDKNENLFYILSGYSYASTQAMLNKKNGGDSNE